MRRGNLIVCLLCVFALLADLSKSGRFELSFPFISTPVDVARRVPESARALRDYSAEWADQKFAALQEYQGQALIEQAALECSDPVTSGYQYVAESQWTVFLELQPIQQRVTFEQAVETLGEPLCLSSPYSAIWIESDGRVFEISFATYYAPDHWGYRVTGFRDVELSKTSGDIAGQSL